jgi:hypothetical protein
MNNCRSEGRSSLLPKRYWPSIVAHSLVRYRQHSAERDRLPRGGA